VLLFRDAGSVEVASPLLRGEPSLRRTQPRLPEGNELVEAAAQLALPATHPASGLEGDDTTRIGSKPTASTGGFGPSR
jgi:hypothetical protein